MASNHKLTKVLRGRVVQTLDQQDGKLLVTFRDGSAMTVKVAKPVEGTYQGATVKAVRQADTRLDLDFEDGSTLEATTAEATSSVMVRAKDHAMEYAD